MPAYKDKETGTWYVSFYYKDWNNQNKKKFKRGFATRKEALEYESNFLVLRNKSIDVSLNEFYEILLLSTEIWSSNQLKKGPLYLRKRFPLEETSETFSAHLIVLDYLLLYLLEPLNSFFNSVAFTAHVNYVRLMGQSIYDSSSKNGILKYFIPAIKCQVRGNDN